ncbi:uncharacterized protein LOC119668674 [Teleopsis dalmanni]|uniref:uncharacterized protein LOC119668674 n=1 Tax=Teleopsis dalmanni TaxID=139649 RepID=UPI000D329F8C|nr:uncharacterized protein LOC119668674 [Teleopsis dalmanni]
MDEFGDFDKPTPISLQKEKLCRQFVDDMKAATQHDLEMGNSAEKERMLTEVIQFSSCPKLQDTLLRYGILEVYAEWLDPRKDEFPSYDVRLGILQTLNMDPRKEELPSYEVRLVILQALNKLILEHTDELINSKVMDTILFLYYHPFECEVLKEMCACILLSDHSSYSTNLNPESETDTDEYMDSEYFSDSALNADMISFKNSDLDSDSTSDVSSKTF